MKWKKDTRKDKIFDVFTQEKFLIADLAARTNPKHSFKEGALIT